MNIDITGKKIKSAQLNEDELLLELDDGLLFVVSGDRLEYTTRKCLIWNWDGARFWWWAVRDSGLNYIINVNQDGEFRLAVSGEHYYFDSLQEAKDKAQEICNADLPAVLPNQHGVPSL